MNLQQLIKPLNEIDIHGNIDIDLKGIADDSRKVREGFVFVAIPGLTVDGHDFIPQAVKNGAVAVIGERDTKDFEMGETSYIKVQDSRLALSLVASEWYGNPAKRMKLVGVTGTDGKTTTVNIIYNILSTTYKTGMISTVNARIGDKEYDTGLHVTNAEPLEMQKFLKEMVDVGTEYVVLEVTSHGIAQERIGGLEFSVGVLTNITRGEALEYHKTFENYRDEKLRLFLHSDKSVLNAEDESFDYFSEKLRDKVVMAYDIRTLKGRVKEAVWNRFPERYNKMNATAAVTTARLFQIDDDLIMEAVQRFPGVKGRMDVIENDLGITTIVDFAHTPNALKSVLEELRKKVGQNNKLIVVFGCAGERDPGKRKAMGGVAAEIADISVFTAEDPRNEDVMEILEEMQQGADEKDSKAKVYQVPERGEAIYEAINKYARKGDVVVVCGKGHEQSMAYNDIEYPWSDHEAVKMALEGKMKIIER